MEKDQQSINQEKKSLQPNKKNTFDNVIDYLNTLHLNYQIIEHDQVRTSLQASQIRNTPLQWGSKTMLIKSSDLAQPIILLIYRANLPLNWKKIKKIPIIGKKMKILTEEEVQQLGVKPGGVPPFKQVFKQKIISILDEGFEDIQMMAFNAGAKNKSIIMKSKDYKWIDCLRASITDND